MIILASKILTVATPDINNGAVVIKGRKIIAVGGQKEILGRYSDSKVVDLSGCVLMPGLVNLHTHLDLSYLQGKLGEHESFFDWINKLVTVRRGLGIRSAGKAAAEALKEAVATGTTCIGDISTTDIALQVIKKSGVRAVSFLESIGMDGRNAGPCFDNLLERFFSLKNLPGRMSLGVSPHSTYAVSGRLYNKLSRYISSNGLLTCIHLSETIDEHLYLNGKPSRLDGYMKNFGWDRLKRNTGRSPVKFIQGFGLHEGMVAVHAVNVSKADMKVLKKAGASVCHCPRSNHFLKVGKAPVEEFFSNGINVGIGTDSLASNLDLDLWEEMRFAYLINNLRARQVVEMATINGARALRLDHVTGSIEPGKEADIIAIKTRASKMEDPYQHLVLSTRKEDIMMTMVQGKTLHLRGGI